MATAHDVAAHAHHVPEEEFHRGGERKTLFVVVLALVMMVGELVIGYTTNSMALTADGWHMGTHVGALGLTLVAYWYARTRANRGEFTFGTGKVYALAGFTSGVVLAIVAILLAIEGIEHLFSHDPVNYGEALVVAVIGLVVNGVSALIMGHNHHYGHDHGHGHDHDHDHDHAHDHGQHDHAHGEDQVAVPGLGGKKAGTLDFNLRAAYIHILADAMTSLMAIAALALGKWANVQFLDPLMGVIAGGVIIWWSINLCGAASRQLLDVASEASEEAKVRATLEGIDDVKVADLHVWDLGRDRRSCVVTLVTKTPRDVEFYRKRVLDSMKLSHLTIEVHRCDHHEDSHRGAAAIAHAHAHGHAHRHDHGHDHDH